MAASLSLFTALQHCFRTAALALLDLGRLVALIARSRSALSAEDLFLRKQLALFQNERHLKLILRPWVAHFNHGRPHMSLGLAMPAPLLTAPPKSTQRHSVPDGHVIRSTAILGGLHHEYSLEKAA